jgi:EAL domain-containing protein (putative c-di-GMP-specific phosphodiesterase class I)/putative methionine-R-sulfoxide reductase with GAF domain
VTERPVTAPRPGRGEEGPKPTPGPAYRLAALAARALGFADATFALIDGPVQGVMASTTPRSDAEGLVAAHLCSSVAASAEPLVVEDLSRTDHPVAEGAAVAGAFVGVPLIDHGQHVVGVLYLTDVAPRTVSPRDLALLTDFAAVAADQLDLTRRANHLDGPTEQGVAALVRAIGHGEIVPWYQPLVDLSTGRVIGLEALARWEHSSGALDDPSVFIPLAERTNLIVDLDRAVMRQAFLDLGRWQARHPDLRVSVNLSGRHLDQDDWVDHLLAAVDTAGLAPASVTLELTETARPSGPGLSVQTIDDVRAAGFQVWFDDFGTGWAGLQELIAYPLDGIKLDRSFAAALGRRVDDTVVRAMTTAAVELGLKVTMEGVETQEQAAIARELGCDYGQGYLWSRPLPAARLEAMLVTDDGQLPLLG